MQRIRAHALMLCLAALATACASDSGAQRGGAKPSVVAAFHPLFEASSLIAGKRAEVTNLTPPGAEPHDVELAPPDVDQILDADLLLYMGGGFQPAVEELGAQREAGSVDLLEGLPVMAEGHEEEEGHAGETDPHVWLDPLLMVQVVDKISGALAEVDPAGADDYMSRAESFTSELEALHEEFETGLETCERRLLVTAHTAFGYLAARYQLQQEGVAGVSPEAEPDPQRLAELADLVQSTGTTTVFTGELVSPEVAETLAREAGVETSVLDTLEAAPSEGESGGGYLDRMRSNLEAIREALGCSP